MHFTQLLDNSTKTDKAATQEWYHKRCTAVRAAVGYPEEEQLWGIHTRQTNLESK